MADKLNAVEYPQLMTAKDWRRQATVENLISGSLKNSIRKSMRKDKKIVFVCVVIPFKYFSEDQQIHIIIGRKRSGGAKGRGAVESNKG